MLHKNARDIASHTHTHTNKVIPYFSRRENNQSLSVEKEEEFVLARRERERDARGRPLISSSFDSLKK